MGLHTVSWNLPNVLPISAFPRPVSIFPFHQNTFGLPQSLLSQLWSQFLLPLHWAPYYDWEVSMHCFGSNSLWSAFRKGPESSSLSVTVATVSGSVIILVSFPTACPNCQAFSFPSRLVVYIFIGLILDSIHVIWLFHSPVFTAKSRLRLRW